MADGPPSYRDPYGAPPLADGDTIPVPPPAAPAPSRLRRTVLLCAAIVLALMAAGIAGWI